MHNVPNTTECQVITTVILEIFAVGNSLRLK